MKTKVCVLFGGESTEYEISLRSAASILNNLDKNKYEILTVGITKDGKWYLYEGDWSNIENDSWHNETLKEVCISHGSKYSSILVLNGGTYKEIKIDVVFPVLHGANGEDGTVQGLFEIAGIKYVGAGMLTSCIGMDKEYAKIVFKHIGINQADWVVIHDYESDCLDDIIAQIENKFTYPVFVKPCNTGSSIGIGKADDKNSLIRAINEAFKFDRKILVEELLKGREIECAVLGSGKDIIASCVGEILSGDKFYTYDAKYSSSSTSEVIIPAKIDESVSENIKQNAVKIFKALDGKGLSRVDFFVDGDEVRINEINTMPGFTSISMYPKLFAYEGISYSSLLTKLINIALE